MLRPFRFPPLHQKQLNLAELSGLADKRGLVASEEEVRVQTAFDVLMLNLPKFLCVHQTPLSGHILQHRPSPIAIRALAREGRGRKGEGVSQWPRTDNGHLIPKQGQRFDQSWLSDCCWDEDGDAVEDWGVDCQGGSFGGCGDLRPMSIQRFFSFFLFFFLAEKLAGNHLIQCFIQPFFKKTLCFYDSQFDTIITTYCMYIFILKQQIQLFANFVKKKKNYLAAKAELKIYLLYMESTVAVTFLQLRQISSGSLSRCRAFLKSKIFSTLLPEWPDKSSCQGLWVLCCFLPGLHLQETTEKRQWSSEKKTHAGHAAGKPRSTVRLFYT